MTEGNFSPEAHAAMDTLLQRVFASTAWRERIAARDKSGGVIEELFLVTASLYQAAHYRQPLSPNSITTLEYIDACMQPDPATRVEWVLGGAKLLHMGRWAGITREISGVVSDLAKNRAPTYEAALSKLYTGYLALTAGFSYSDSTLAQELAGLWPNVPYATSEEPVNQEEIQRLQQHFSDTRLAAPLIYIPSLSLQKGLERLDKAYQIYAERAQPDTSGPTYQGLLRLLGAQQSMARPQSMLEVKRSVPALDTIQLGGLIKNIKAQFAESAQLIHLDASIVQREAYALNRGFVLPDTITFGQFLAHLNRRSELLFRAFGGLYPFTAPMDPAAIAVHFGIRPDRVPIEEQRLALQVRQLLQLSPEAFAHEPDQRGYYGLEELAKMLATRGDKLTEKEADIVRALSGFPPYRLPVPVAQLMRKWDMPRRKVESTERLALQVLRGMPAMAEVIAQEAQVELRQLLLPPLTYEARSVNKYVAKIIKYRLLRAEEEVQLAMYIEAGLYAAQKLEEGEAMDPQQEQDLRTIVREGEVAKRRFVESNLRLVVSVSNRYRGRGVPQLDLIQEGNIGLQRAVEGFDYTLGYKFSSYAMWWIRQRMIRAVADQGRLIHIPHDMIDRLKKLNDVRRQLLNQQQHAPTVSQLAVGLRLSEAQVKELLRYEKDVLSLDQVVEDGTPLSEFVRSNEPGYTAVEEAAVSARLRALLQTLPERDAGVLSMRLGLTDGITHTVDEVAAAYHMERHSVPRIVERTLARLRALAAAEEITP